MDTITPNCLPPPLLLPGTLILLLLSLKLALDAHTFLRPHRSPCCPPSSRDTFTLITGGSAGVGAVALLYFAVVLALDVGSFSSSAAAHCPGDDRGSWALACGATAGISIMRALKVAEADPRFKRCEVCKSTSWVEGWSRKLRDALGNGGWANAPFRGGEKAGKKRVSF